MSDKRLEKELKEMKALSKESYVSACAVENDLHHWKGHLQGPKWTPYEGGLFVIDIQIPSNYPYSPPSMKFDTKIWHPSIDSKTGAICLDVLAQQWSPLLTIRTALLSIEGLLSGPEPDHGLDQEVWSMYSTRRDLFNQTAKRWTETYAQGAVDIEEEEEIEQRCGFFHWMTCGACEAGGYAHSDDDELHE
eukprot:gnl/MRDRNA2_/MRDRNA2_100361_c0_seq1.p1 gnl/MRDRNA2_/MRDRNA2_100361_c0~~gnl/MRDRNA2_/MRDRNA2_100361_c0_seq1.p1  ORF type:complete len:191 (-),score=37.48 gnl/MRDRNA2_/MRDRNA2_100361_c0_seq1:626-1198(-)